MKIQIVDIQLTPTQLVQGFYDDDDDDLPINDPKVEMEYFKIKVHQKGSSTKEPNELRSCRIWI